VRTRSIAAKPRSWRERGPLVMPPHDPPGGGGSSGFRRGNPVVASFRKACMPSLPRDDAEEEARRGLRRGVGDRDPFVIGAGNFLAADDFETAFRFGPAGEVVAQPDFVRGGVGPGAGDVG